MTGQQQFLNWLVSKLPENTRLRIEDLYAEVFAANREGEEEVIKNKRAGIKKEEVQERFYRVIEDESDRIPVIGNARQQETYKSRINDEEYGSVIQFKVPRACRRHIHEQAALQQSQ